MKGSTIKNFLIVQKEQSREVSREVAYYNLQMIIAVGFKVSNEREENLNTKEKGLKDVLTIADTTSEKIITEEIKKLFPNYNGKMHEKFVKIIKDAQ